MVLHSGAKWLQNIKADSIEFPCVFMDRPINWKPIKVGKYAARQEVYTPYLFFCEKTRPEWTQEQHDEVIERQRLNVAKFLETLSMHPEVDLITQDPTCNDIINFLDLNTSGVSVTFQIRLKQDTAVCADVPLLPSNPIIAYITPEQAYTYSTTTITLIGTGFVDGCEISVNGSDIEVGSTTFTSSEHLEVQLVLPGETLAGTRSITVTNPDGRSFTKENCLQIIPD